MSRDRIELMTATEPQFATIRRFQRRKEAAELASERRGVRDQTHPAIDSPPLEKDIQKYFFDLEWDFPELARSSY